MARDVDYSRLCKAISKSRLVLRRARQERLELARYRAGNHWSEEGKQERQLVNLISMYVDIMGESLIPQDPRVMLSTFDQNLKPTVAAMQKWANQEIKRLHLRETFLHFVTDSLYSIGIAKVAITTPADSAAAAWSIGAGQVGVWCVDLDDFVYETEASNFLYAGFIGHRFRVPLDVVKDSKFYSKARKRLEPSDLRLYNQEGDERISVLGRSFYSNKEEFRDMVDLWELYLPQHRRVVTIADADLGGPEGSGGVTEPLREQVFIGPESGPYEYLGLGSVPGNAMPKAPLMDLADLHEEVNEAERKMARTMERMKEITLVQRGATESGDRVIKCNDGDMIAVDDPANFAQVVFGGQHIQALMAIATEARSKFNDVGGNLALLGGRGPQSKTATQDEMLNANAAAGVAGKQRKVVSAITGIFEKMLWYWWHDPFKVQTVEHTIAGLPGVGATLRVHPGNHPDPRSMRRKGDMPDIIVDPYSLRHQTPESRLEAINQVVTQIVIPMMQLLVQSGVMFDVKAYLAKIGQYMDLPDLQDILTIQPAPVADTEQGAPDKPTTAPPSQPREYVRHNVSEQTPQGGDRNFVQSMLGSEVGGNPNGQQNGRKI